MSDEIDDIVDSLSVQMCNCCAPCDGDKLEDGVILCANCGNVLRKE